MCFNDAIFGSKFYIHAMLNLEDEYYFQKEQGGNID